MPHLEILDFRDWEFAKFPQLPTWLARHGTILAFGVSKYFICSTGGYGRKKRKAEERAGNRQLMR